MKTYKIDHCYYDGKRSTIDEYTIKANSEKEAILKVSPEYISGWEWRVGQYTTTLEYTGHREVDNCYWMTRNKQ